MKRSIIIAILALLTVPAMASGGETKKDVREQVRDLVMEQGILDALNAEGELNISFTIDEDNRVQLETVNTEDYSLEYHVRQTLQNVQVAANQSLVGRTISLVVDIVRSK